MDNILKWDNNFISGIEEIDEQHKEIIDKVNALYKAVDEKQDKETIIKIIESLDFYTSTHFDSEEKYMKKYNYDNLEEHKKTHDFFKSTYDQIRYNYFYIKDKNSPDYKLAYLLALHLSQILIDWLNLHLTTFDKEFAAYIKNIKQ